MLVVWETEDSFLSKTLIWSGAGPLFMDGIKLYATDQEVYIAGVYDLFNKRLARIRTHDKSYYTQEVAPSSNSRTLVMCHYITEEGYKQHSALLETMSGAGNDFFVSYYPEYSESWVTVSSMPSPPVDIVFPDSLDSPRFVIGLAGNTIQKIIIVLADNNQLSNRYNTTWGGNLNPNAAITDLEVVRYI